MQIRRMFFCGVAATALCGAQAVTVSVDGVGGTATTFATIHDAVSHTNGQGAGPHVINITVDELGALNAGHPGVSITEAVTINGNANGGNRCVQHVKQDGGEPVTDPASNFAFLEVSTDGDVVINDLIMVPDSQGDGAAKDLSCIVLAGSAAGPLNFSINNCWITGANATTGVPADPSVDTYTSALRFYGSTANTAGSGIHSQVGNTINVSMTDTAVSHTRGALVVFKHTAGSVDINEGCLSTAGGSVGVGLRDQTNAVAVNIDGTYEKRVVFWSTRQNATQADGLFLGSGVAPSGTITSLTYVDAVSNGCDGIDINEGQLGTMAFVRAALNSSVANGFKNFRIGSGTNHNPTINSSTFHATAGTAANNPETFELVAGFAGTVTVKDSIFSGAGRKIDLGTAATVNFDHCAIVTNGTHALAGTGTMASGTFLGQNPDSNVAPINADPMYATATFSAANQQNENFLRPQNSAAYTAASSTGGNLVGGAGGTEVPVSLSGFTIE